MERHQAVAVGTMSAIAAWRRAASRTGTMAFDDRFGSAPGPGDGGTQASQPGPAAQGAPGVAPGYGAPGTPPGCGAPAYGQSPGPAPQPGSSPWAPAPGYGAPGTPPGYGAPPAYGQPWGPEQQPESSPWGAAPGGYGPGGYEAYPLAVGYGMVALAGPAPGVTWAGLGARFGALSIDLLVMFGSSIVAGVLMEAAGTKRLANGDIDYSTGATVVVLAWLAFVIAYNPVSWYFKGQTFGQRGNFRTFRFQLDDIQNK